MATAHGRRSASARTSSSRHGGLSRNRWCLGCSIPRSRTKAMAAPKFAPVPPIDTVRTYESPEHIPAPWMPDRPAEINGRQPEGERLGFQGPDQGYVLTLAERFRDKIIVGAGESVNDAIRGCTNVALRRASIFGRAPVIHDLTIAFTMWGWLDASPTIELAVARRR